MEADGRDECLPLTPATSGFPHKSSIFSSSGTGAGGDAPALCPAILGRGGEHVSGTPLRSEPYAVATATAHTTPSRYPYVGEMRYHPNEYLHLPRLLTFGNGMPYITSISGLEPWVIALLNIVFILLVTWIVSKVAVWILHRTAFRKDNDLPAATIFINIIRVLIWTIGIATIFRVCFGVDVAGFIAALGVGGIAVSLGFQDTLLNLFGGLQLSLGKLALPGDYIRVMETEGIIKDITWRHTVLIDEDDDEHLIPNSLMNKNNITCLSPAG